MVGFTIFEKLSIDEAVANMREIEAWFERNPKKKICQTDLFRVRRGFIVRDILSHTKETNQ